MKRNTPNHPKVRNLARALGKPLYAAVGILEMLWHFTADYAPEGDIGRWSDEQIAAALDWDGETIRLIESLTLTHFVDLSETHRLIVHDWCDHAPDATQVFLARKGLLFADGKKPKDKRLAIKERESTSTLCAQKAHKSALTGARTTTTTTTTTTTKNPPSPLAGVAPSVVDFFDRFWAAWPKHPRKVDRKRVVKALDVAFRESSEPDALAETIIEAVELFERSEQWRADNGKFIPAPLVWVNQRRWEGADALRPKPKPKAPAERWTRAQSFWLREMRRGRESAAVELWQPGLTAEELADVRAEWKIECEAKAGLSQGEVADDTFEPEKTQPRSRNQGFEGTG